MEGPGWWRRDRAGWLPRLLILAWTVIVGLTLVAVLADRDDGGDSAEPVVVEGPLAGDEDDLLDQLRDGGLVVYQRHTETTEGGVDSLESLASCDLQRELSDDGRRDAVEIGEAFRSLDIPVGRVVSSPFCRVVETAERAFDGAEIEVTESLLSLATAREDSEATEERIAAGARALVSAPPEPGTNTVLVGSVSNAEGVIGVGMEEGGAIVLRPGGDGEFEVLAVIRPQGWQTLAGSRR